ncbi:MAG: hypothetical protein ACI4Q4_02835 [Oscillospiraceae bacterium]
MKRTIAAALAAAACLSVAGCSGEKDSGRTSSAPSESESVVSAAITVATEESSLAETAEVPARESAEAETESLEQTSEQTSEPEDTTNYAEYVMRFDNSYLGLPSPSKVYVFSDKKQTADIDGQVFHAVSCFDEHEGTLYYMCDYYISEDGQTVYRDETSKNGLEGVPPEFVLMPENRGFELLDPTTQTADEIFAAANELSALFTPFGSRVIACDSGDTIEVDGWQFDRVSDEHFSTKEKLLTTLDSYFSSELINVWMEQGNVVERDGGIYLRHNDGTGSNPYLDHREYELTELTADAASFTEYLYYIYEGNEEEVVERSYTAKLVNGVWRFTEFVLVDGE